MLHQASGTSASHYGPVVPDVIFTHPRLAEIYDAFDDERDDLLAYVGMADELDARTVLDVGCGTGSLAVLLARRGFTVIGVDPAAASLAVARRKPGADAVTWIDGDATSLPTLEADLALMTGNVGQVFLTDVDWAATLRGIRRALRPGGHLVFETRRPERRAWEDWAADPGPVVREVAGVGEVEQRHEVLDVALPYVSFRYTYTFASDGLVVISDSTLRFRGRTEIQESLTANGFRTVDVRDAPDRPGLEYVFVAQRT
jgi:ubiquinone/menaquinone biosynthesis C-methylase UbiE